MARYTHIIFIALIAVYCFLNIFLMENDSCTFLMQGKDWQTHIRNYARFIEPQPVLPQSSFLDRVGLRLRHLILVDRDYPPLYYWTAALAAGAGRFLIPHAVLLTSTLFWVVLMSALYKIGELTRKGTGLAAVLVCSLYPIILRSSRVFNLELAVCALVVLSMYVLIKTDSFKNRKYSVFFGLSLGAGMLTKYTFGLFLFAPFCAVLLDAYKTGIPDHSRRKRFLNAGFSLLIGIMIGAVYYAHPGVIGHLVERATDITYGMDIAYKSPGQKLIYYVFSLAAPGGMGLPVFLVSVTLSMVFFKSANEYKKLFFLWVFVPFFVVSFTPEYYQVEYLIPLLPALALMSASVIMHTRGLILRTVMAGVFIAAAAGQCLPPPGDDKMFCFDEHPRFVTGIFAFLAEKRYSMGYLDDVVSEKYCYGVNQFFAVWGKGPERVDNFFESPLRFVEKIGSYDVLFNVSADEAEWPDTVTLARRIEEYCRVKKIEFVSQSGVASGFEGKKLSLEPGDINKISRAQSSFVRVAAFTFFPLQTTAYPRLRWSVFLKKNALINHPGEAPETGSFGAALFERKKMMIRGDCRGVINTLFSLSRDLRKEKKYDESLRVLLKARSFKPENGPVVVEMVDLSRELRKEKKYADVLRVLRTGGAERNRELYYQELDALFAEWNDSGIMLDFYGEAYKHDPNDPRICLRLARTYRLIRDYEHSREYFRKTLDLQPGNPEAAEGIRNADYFLNITK